MVEYVGKGGGVYEVYEQGKKIGERKFTPIYNSKGDYQAIQEERTIIKTPESPITSLQPNISTTRGEAYIAPPTKEEPRSVPQYAQSIEPNITLRTGDQARVLTPVTRTTSADVLRIIEHPETIINNRAITQTTVQEKEVSQLKQKYESLPSQTATQKIVKGYYGASALAGTFDVAVHKGVKQFGEYVVEHPLQTATLTAIALTPAGLLGAGFVGIGTTASLVTSAYFGVETVKFAIPKISAFKGSVDTFSKTAIIGETVGELAPAVAFLSLAGAGVKSGVTQARFGVGSLKSDVNVLVASEQASLKVQKPSITTGISEKSTTARAGQVSITGSGSYRGEPVSVKGELSRTGTGEIVAVVGKKTVYQTITPKEVFTIVTQKKLLGGEKVISRDVKPRTPAPREFEEVLQKQTSKAVLPDKLTAVSSAQELKVGGITSRKGIGFIEQTIDTSTVRLDTSLKTSKITTQKYITESGTFDIGEGIKTSSPLSLGTTGEFVKGSLDVKEISPKIRFGKESKVQGVYNVKFETTPEVAKLTIAQPPTISEKTLAQSESIKKITFTEGRRVLGKKAEFSAGEQISEIDKTSVTIKEAETSLRSSKIKNSLNIAELLKASEVSKIKPLLVIIPKTVQTPTTAQVSTIKPLTVIETFQTPKATTIPRTTIRITPKISQTPITTTSSILEPSISRVPTTRVSITRIPSIPSYVPTSYVPQAPRVYGFQEIKRTGASGVRKEPKGYVPSLVAVARNITARSIPKIAEYSGVGIRPILLNRGKNYARY